MLHAHDWHTGPALMYLATRGRREAKFKSIASLLTIHNLYWQGAGGNALFRFAGFNQTPPRLIGEAPGSVNWLARGIAYADAINTVSPTYAKQILTREFGEGLSELLRTRRDQLGGVLNGLDLREWNPQTDRLLAERFDGGLAEEARGEQARGAGRIELEAQAAHAAHRPGLAPVRAKGPRHFGGSGVELLAARCAVRHSGQRRRKISRRACRRWPSSIRAASAFDHDFNEPLARQIYGGCDVFLMPSHFEPCGLGQMIAMRYGAVPVVRATGGLADTVIDADRSPKRGTGFIFTAYTAGGVGRRARSGPGGLRGSRSLAGHAAARHGRRFFVEGLGAAVRGTVSPGDRVASEPGK